MLGRERLRVIGGSPQKCIANLLRRSTFLILNLRAHVEKNNCGDSLLITYSVSMIRTVPMASLRRACLGFKLQAH